jgi:DNA-binding PadR family transcriptional regulator
MSRRSLGDFEQLVLLAILRTGEDAYAASILREIESRTGRRVAHAAVYIALRRLEAKGLVSSRLADPTPERGGRAKRYFRVVPAALPQLRDSRDALLSMWEGLEAES